MVCSVGARQFAGYGGLVLLFLPALYAARFRIKSTGGDP
jgi:hypothetical protein